MTWESRKKKGCQEAFAARGGPLYLSSLPLLFILSYLHRSNLSEEVEYTRFLPLNGSFKEGAHAGLHDVQVDYMECEHPPLPCSSVPVAS